MKDNTYFTITSTSIIHETIKNDTLIINLNKGIYYNLSDIASDYWLILLGGYSKENLVECVSKKYSITPEQITQDLDNFISNLKEQNLIKDQEYQSRILDESIEITFHSETYCKPIIKRYSDMESLLLADPLYEFFDE